MKPIQSQYFQKGDTELMDNKMELAKAIKDGTLDLVCPEMQLLVCPAYSDVALKGSGVLRADKLGQLYFHLVASFKGASHNIFRQSKQPGEIHVPEDYVMLCAIDEFGREWRSNWMILDFGNQIPLPNWRIRKNLSSLLHAETTKKIDSSSVQIMIPNAPLLPLDLKTNTRKSAGDREIAWGYSFDHHTHQIDDAEITFRSENDGWLSVQANRPNAIMPTWAGLLCQSIGFVTAQTVRPAVITRKFSDRTDTHLLSGPFWRLPSMMPGPVRVKGLNEAGHFWQLLELVFKYLEQGGNGADRVIEEIEGIRRGAQGSFQTACLTLAVGIESIAKLLLNEEKPPQLDSDVIQSLLNHINAWPGDDKVKKRVEGVIRRLTETSAADLIYAWATRTGTPHGLIGKSTSQRGWGESDATDDAKIER